MLSLALVLDSAISTAFPVGRVDHQRARSHAATQASVRPPPKGERTIWPSRLSELITDWPSRRHTKKMLISNEAERLVYEPGPAGQKSEVMMSPASRFA